MYNGPEILAPAGSMEALRAAVECGADAVYLGAGHFNARRNAKNFSEEELREAIEYCHVRGVKVHLTLNTLVSDEELPRAIDLIEQACALGVDALIIQDLGVAALARAAAPDMELHASTQMSVMTPEGFRALADAGFSRAVLPRELSLEEIRAVREATKDTGLELEFFVHGALCMCVSGQCYLSAMMGGRSGNRGLCAQPCRLPFSAGTETHALSLRDLSAIRSIPELWAMGVTSFKIEGRMKRPEYVAAATKACRNAADGVFDPRLEEELTAVFSRSGHTEGYLRDARGPEMFGTRQKDDVTAAASVLKDLTALYKKETRATPVALHFEARRESPLRLTACRGDVSVTVDTAGHFLPEPAQNRAADAEGVLRQLLKSGGTGFSVEERDVQIDLEEGLHLPASALNDLRRSALEALKKELLAQFVKTFDRAAADAVLQESLPDGPAPLFENGTAVVRLRVPEQLPDALLQHPHLAWILPLDTPPERLRELAAQDVRFGVEIPRGLYESAAAVPEQLDRAKTAGASFAYAGTLDGVVLGKEAGLPVLGGPTLNAFNAVALRELSALGVDALIASQELRLTQIDALPKQELSIGFPAYGRQPLMLTRLFPNGLTEQDFRDPAHLPELTDRKQIRFPVARSGDACELLNSRPLWLADRRDEFPKATFAFLYMTTETADDAADVLERYERAAPPEGDFTRGLGWKGVL